MQTQLIFDFDIQSDSSNWRVVDDVVMGCLLYTSDAADE